VGPLSTHSLFSPMQYFPGWVNKEPIVPSRLASRSTLEKAYVPQRASFVKRKVRRIDVLVCRI